jgi:hypothetical protein
LLRLLPWFVLTFLIVGGVVVLAAVPVVVLIADAQLLSHRPDGPEASRLVFAEDYILAACPRQT